MGPLLIQITTAIQGDYFRENKQTGKVEMLGDVSENRCYLSSYLNLSSIKFFLCTILVKSYRI